MSNGVKKSFNKNASLSLLKKAPAKSEARVRRLFKKIRQKLIKGLSAF